MAIISTDHLSERDLADIDAAVRAGAAYLDAKVPGWRGHIDVASLNIADPWDCVLGQIAKGEGWVTGSIRMGYHVALKRLGLSVTQASEYGFTAFVVHGNYSNRDLTPAWVRLLSTDQ